MTTVSVIIASVATLCNGNVTIEYIDGGDATSLIHKVEEFDEKYAKGGSLPDSVITNNVEFQCILIFDPDGQKQVQA